MRGARDSAPHRPCRSHAAPVEHTAPSSPAPSSPAPLPHRSHPARGRGLRPLGVQAADSGKADFKPLYDEELSLEEKIRTIAQEIYGHPRTPPRTRTRAHASVHTHPSHPRAWVTRPGSALTRPAANERPAPHQRARRALCAASPPGCPTIARGSAGADAPADAVLPLLAPRCPLLCAGADDIAIDKSAMTKLKQFTKLGYGNAPVCMAKTQYSFTADATAIGAPSGHIIPVADARLSAGAEFVVVLTGSIMTMPGLPKIPAAEHVGIDTDGTVKGLF